MAQNNPKEEKLAPGDLCFITGVPAQEGEEINNKIVKVLFRCHIGHIFVIPAHNGHPAIRTMLVGGAEEWMVQSMGSPIRIKCRTLDPCVFPVMELPLLRCYLRKIHPPEVGEDTEIVTTTTLKEPVLL
jgi:hypothetical protein